MKVARTLSILCLCITAILILCLLPAQAEASVVNSGICGDNLSWTLDDEGTLCISGTGNMDNWTTYVSAPWYTECENIRVVIIENGVTNIGTRAFEDCYNLISVKIPDSVKTVGERAFTACSRLSTITLPEDITAIGDYTFDNCSSLSSVNIPNGVTAIGNSAFFYCQGLTSVIIPDSVMSIGRQAFLGCNSIATIHIGAGVSTIEKDAFYACSKINDVYITDPSAWCKISFENADANPMSYGEYMHILDEKGEEERDITLDETVTVIPDYAFKGCILYTVTMRDNVTQIGKEAFADASKLFVVDIGNSVTHIDDYAFEGCVKLTTLMIPNSVVTIGKGAFFDTGIETVYMGTGIAVIGANAFATCGNLKDVYITDPSAWCKISFGNAQSNPIYRGAQFHILDENENEIADVVLDNTVTAIQDYAFYGCINLTSVVIPDSVTGIGDAAFSSCSGLKSVTVGSGVTTIGSNAFYNCSSLTDVYSTDTTAWCKIVLENKYSNPCYDSDDRLHFLDENGNEITDIVLDPTITAIRDKAFYGCENLISVTIPKGVTAIGEAAFVRCYNLTGVYITDPSAWCKISFGNATANPIYMGARLYILGNNGTEITDVVLDSTVTAIPEYAFANTSIKSVTISDSVVTVGEYAFYNCENLAKAYIGSGVTTIGANAFYNCTALALLELSDSVTTIERNAFAGCDSLTSVFLGKSIAEIGENAFNCSSLTDVYITDPNAWCKVEFEDWYANPIYWTKATHILDESGNEITELILDNTVTEIPDIAFSKASIKSITLSDSITTIGNSAFSSCANLTTVDFSDSVTTIIQDGAFLDCDSLIVVKIPAGVTTIGQWAFSYCDNLLGILVDENNPNYSSDEKGILFNKDRSILIQTPGGMSGHYTIPDSVETIDAYAFNECQKLTAVTIPGNVTTINRAAFQDCSQLTTVRTNVGLHYIGEDAFRNCTSLTAISFPNSVRMIDNGAFINCGLTSVIIPDDVLAVGGAAFAACSRLTDVIIGKGITTIEQYTFYSCRKLTSVTVPAEVTTIRMNAFSDSNEIKYAYYGGTQAQWQSIHTDSPNVQFLIADTIYYNHNHKYTVATTMEATCTEDGYVEHICIHGDKFREILPKTEHYLGTASQVMMPTCTTQGYTTQECLHCKEIVNTNHIAPLGHNMVDAAAVKPTCTQIGFTAGSKCNCCDYTTQEKITALGHSIADGFCTVCGAPERASGDLDENEGVTTDDVVTLLLYISMPDMFSLPEGVSADFTGDGQVTTDDAVTLLLHISMPDMFPLEIKKEE